MNLDDLRARNFVTVAEAAGFFGDCDERTVRRAIEAEQLPAVRLGTKTLIPVPPLLALLQAPEQSPAPAASGLDPELVAHALDMIRAALRVLEPLMPDADVRTLNPVQDPDAAA